MSGYKSKEKIVNNYVYMILTSLVFFFLLMKASYGEEEYSVSNLPNFIYIFQNISLFGALLSLLSMVLISVFFKKNKVKFSISLIIYFFLLVWYYLRSYWVGSGDINNVFAILVIFSLFVCAISVDRKDSISINIAFTFPLIISLSVWCLLNYTLYLTGYGYNLIEGSSRFFGTTAHPNSCGAYAVISFVLFFLSFLKNYKKKEYKKSFLFGVLAFISLNLIFIAGSRSGMLAAILGILTITPIYLWVIPMILIFVIYLVYIIKVFPESMIFLAFDRMKNAPLDNRDEVWVALISDFQKHPILGSGDFSGVSGNGFLTAFGGTGFFGGMLFLMLVVYMLYKISINKLFVGHGKIEDYIVLINVLVVVIFSLSIFEGFIFDKFGFIQVLTLFILALIGPFNQKYKCN